MFINIRLGVCNRREVTLDNQNKWLHEGLSSLRTAGHPTAREVGTEGRHGDATLEFLPRGAISEARQCTQWPRFWCVTVIRVAVW